MLRCYEAVVNSTDHCAPACLPGCLAGWLFICLPACLPVNLKPCRGALFAEQRYNAALADLGWGW